MKSNLVKLSVALTSVLLVTACGGAKDNKSNNVSPTVGPQGRINSFSSNDEFCDINNGTIICSRQDLNTHQTLCTTQPRSYDSQNITSLCQQVSAIRAEANNVGGCNVLNVTTRILSENCSGSGFNPNNPNQPNNPNNPFPNPVPQSGFITCSVSFGGNYTAMPFSIPKMDRYKYELGLQEPRKTFFGQLFSPITGGKRVGHINLIYTKADDSLAANIEYKDKATDRVVRTVHIGDASGPLTMDAKINGASISISCNSNVKTRPQSDVAQLVCTGNSNLVAGNGPEENIQFTKFLSDIVSNEDMQISEAVSVSLDKATSVLKVKTIIDSELGPDMTSSSSLSKSGASIGASEGLGKANIKCKIQ